MTSDEAELDRMRLLMAAAAERTTCPSTDLLARAATGEASAAERRVVADHLATCPDCSEEYRVASSLGAWSRDPSRPRELTDIARDAVHSDGAETSALASRAGARGDFMNAAWLAQRRAWTPDAPRWVSLTAAAAIVVALAATLAWSLSLRRENARLAAQLRADAGTASTPAPLSSSIGELTRRVDAQQTELTSLRARLDEALAPALNVPIVDLLPREAARGAATSAVVRVPASARMVTFVVSLATEPGARDHELEIVGPSGTVVWHGSGLRPNAEKTFTVTVPRALLPAGTSRLRLFVPQNGTRRMVGEYAITLEP